MTQAQLDLQSQLKQNTTDLTIQPLLIDSPILFLEAMDQDQSATNNEQIELNTKAPKDQISSEIRSIDNTRETSPPPKMKYEIMKDHAFVSSPIYPPLLPSKPSLSTNRDDHLMPIFSQDCFTFKSQLTFLYRHPTDYTFKLYDKHQHFFT